MVKKMLCKTALALSLMLPLQKDSYVAKDSSIKDHTRLVEAIKEPNFQEPDLEKVIEYASVHAQKEITMNHLEKFKTKNIQNQTLYFLNNIPVNIDSNSTKDTVAALSFTYVDDVLKLTNLVINVDGKTMVRYKDSGSNGIRSRKEGDIYNIRNTKLDRMERHTNFLDDGATYNNLRIDAEFSNKLKRIGEYLNNSQYKK